MQRPAIPANEPERLRSLEALELLYTPAEERFDRITRIASSIFGTPIAIVTLVADKVQWFKSAQGLDAPETPREISFCGHAILGDETFVIEDASRDERFADNPLVLGDPRIRFYAGQPLYARDGNAVGTLCVIDRAPREFSPKDCETLRDLAALVETELDRAQLNEAQSNLLAERDDLQRKASIDALTRTWNRSAIDRLIQLELNRASRGKPPSVALIDVDNLERINATFGRQTGDAVLMKAIERVRGTIRDVDSIGRYGDDEFVVVLSDCRAEPALEISERIRQAIASDKAVTVSIGVAHGSAETTPETLLEAAGEALLRAKKLGPNRVALAGHDHAGIAAGMSSWRKRKRW